MTILGPRGIAWLSGKKLPGLPVTTPLWVGILFRLSLPLCVRILSHGGFGFLGARYELIGLKCAGEGLPPLFNPKDPTLQANAVLLRGGPILLEVW